MNIEHIRQQAQNQNTLSEVLAQLANHEDKLVRQYVASNPNTSIEILSKLSNEFPEEVFTNPIIDIVFADNSQKIPLNLMIMRERYLTGSEGFFLTDGVCDDAKAWSIVEDRIAQDENTSPETLAQLAKSQDKFIRQCVASNPNTPIESLEKLGAEFPEEIINNPIFELVKLENPESEFVQLSEARSSMTSVERLLILASSNHRKVGEAVAGNRKTTTEILEKLIKKEYKKKQSTLFYRQIINHPNSSAKIIDAVLGKCSYGSIQESALNCAKTSAETLKRLAYGVDNLQKYELLAKHPHVSPEILNIAQITMNSEAVIPEVLIEFACRRERIATLAFRHQNMSKEILAQLSLSDLEAVKISVAQHYKTTVATLKHLAQDENKFVREAIAQRQNISEEISTILADDPSESVRVLVAEVKNLTSESILKLAKDSDEAVRCIVLEHHHNLIALSPEILLQLAQDEYKFVRANVAYYQQLSEEVIEILAFDSSLMVRHGLVCDRNYYQSNANSHLPLDILWKMLEQNEASPDLETSPPLTKVINFLDQEVSVRDHELVSERVVNFYIKLAIAIHPDTPLDFLHILIKDEDEQIRAAAASSPKLSAKVLHELLNDNSSRVKWAVLKNSSVASDTLMLYLERSRENKRRCGREVDTQIARQQLRQREQAAIFGMAISITCQKSLSINSLINTYKILNRVGNCYFTL